jgi:hypothetical protein
MLELSKEVKEELLKQRENAISLIEHLDAILGIKSESSDTPKTSTKNAPYKVNDTFQRKFSSILREQGRFLHINEISKIANEYEPSYDFGNIKLKMASAKNNLIGKGEIVKYALENNSNLNTFYGFKEWTKDGVPTEEYKYNEDYVSN